jgi:hypothetical protein
VFYRAASQRIDDLERVDAELEPGMGGVPVVKLGDFGTPLFSVNNLRAFFNSLFFSFCLGESRALYTGAKKVRRAMNGNHFFFSLCRLFVLCL